MSVCELDYSNSFAFEQSPFFHRLDRPPSRFTNVKKKITGLHEQRLPPPPFVSVYRHMPFYNDEERE